MAKFKISCYLDKARAQGIEFERGLGPGVFHTILAEFPDELLKKNPSKAYKGMIEHALSTINSSVDFDIEPVDEIEQNSDFKYH